MGREILETATISFRLNQELLLDLTFARLLSSIHKGYAVRTCLIFMERIRLGKCRTEIRKVRCKIVVLVEACHPRLIQITTEILRPGMRLKETLLQHRNPQGLTRGILLSPS